VHNSSYGSSEDAKKDKRYPFWAKQREERGFDDTELWNLFHHLAEHIAPRLKAFRDHDKVGYPAGLSAKKWQNILSKMIFAFEEISKDDMWDFDEKKNKKVEEGLDLFRKWFLGLWD
jgi:hypothetical protein